MTAATYGYQLIQTVATPEELEEVLEELAMDGVIAALAHTGSRPWILAPDQEGEWWATSWLEEDEPGLDARATSPDSLPFPLSIYAPITADSGLTITLTTSRTDLGRVVTSAQADIEDRIVAARHVARTLRTRLDVDTPGAAERFHLINDILRILEYDAQERDQ